MFQIRRFIFFQPRRQDMLFPGGRWKLQPLELLNHSEHAVSSGEMPGGGKMLPIKQKLHELGGGDRFDLLAHAPESQPVDTREERALAPFYCAWRPRRAIHHGKFAAQHGAGGFQRQQSSIDPRRGQSQPRGQVAGGRRADRFKPALDNIAQCLFRRGYLFNEPERNTDGRIVLNTRNAQAQEITAFRSYPRPHFSVGFRQEPRRNGGAPAFDERRGKGW